MDNQTGSPPPNEPTTSTEKRPKTNIGEWASDGYLHLLSIIQDPSKFWFAYLRSLAPKIGILLLIIIGIAALGYYIGGWKTARENNKIKKDYSTAISSWTVQKQTAEKTIDTLNVELRDAKQDRDKYQTMVAPFQAMALKLYTNAPVEERLNLFADQMFSVSSNFLAAIDENRPSFDLYINNQRMTNSETIFVGTNKTLTIMAHNVSRITADHVMIDFQTPLGITPNDVTMGEGWYPQPPLTDFSDTNLLSTNIIGYYWMFTVDRPIAPNNLHTTSSILLSTNLNYPVVNVGFDIYADNSKRQHFNIGLAFK